MRVGRRSGHLHSYKVGVREMLEVAIKPAPRKERSSHIQIWNFAGSSKSNKSNRKFLMFISLFSVKYGNVFIFTFSLDSYI